VPIETGEADYQILCPALLHLEELPVVHRELYGLPDVVGSLGRIRD
jgi:hypothetical protein